MGLASGIIKRIPIIHHDRQCIPFSYGAPMSQYKPTPDEVDRFAQVLWKQGEKKQLLAFRTTWPDSTAKDAGASSQGHKIATMPTIKERLQELQTQSRAVSDDSFTLDVVSKKRKLFDIIENGTREDETRNGYMVDPRSAIAAIAESNRMDGEYEKDNQQKHEPFFLSINLAGHPDRKTA